MHSCISCGTHLFHYSLADLLEKDSTAQDPGRVVNISSTASISSVAAGSGLAGRGQGLWSCKFRDPFGMITESSL